MSKMPYYTDEIKACVEPALAQLDEAYPSADAGLESSETALLRIGRKILRQLPIGEGDVRIRFPMPSSEDLRTVQREWPRILKKAESMEKNLHRFDPQYEVKVTKHYLNTPAPHGATDWPVPTGAPVALLRIRKVAKVVQPEDVDTQGLSDYEEHLASTPEQPSPSLTSDHE